MDLDERMQSRKKVLDFLEVHRITYELYEHPEFCSVADGLEYWKDIHGDVTHCKNLFMRNRCLGVNPGSVCAFGLINDMNLTDADQKELFDNGHRVKYYLGELPKS